MAWQKMKDNRIQHFSLLFERHALPHVMRHLGATRALSVEAQAAADGDDISSALDRSSSIDWLLAIGSGDLETSLSLLPIAARVGTRRDAPHVTVSRTEARHLLRHHADQRLMAPAVLVKACVVDSVCRWVAVLDGWRAAEALARRKGWAKEGEFARFGVPEVEVIYEAG